MYDRADEDDVFEREPFVVRFRRNKPVGEFSVNYLFSWVEHLMVK